MKAVLIEPIKKPIIKSVSFPGSKSLTNRALVMAALSSGRSTISNASMSSDSLILVQVFKKLGINLPPSGLRPMVSSKVI